jgi:hypothetical protein
LEKEREKEISDNEVQEENYDGEKPRIEDVDSDEEADSSKD